MIRERHAFVMKQFCASLIQGLARGAAARRVSLKRRVKLITDIRLSLLKLWEEAGTPLEHRSIFWGSLGQLDAGRNRKGRGGAKAGKGSKGGKGGKGAKGGKASAAATAAGAAAAKEAETKRLNKAAMMRIQQRMIAGALSSFAEMSTEGGAGKHKENGGGGKEGSKSGRPSSSSSTSAVPIPDNVTFLDVGVSFEDRRRSAVGRGGQQSACELLTQRN